MAKGVHYMTISALQSTCRAIWLFFAPQRNFSYVSSQENNHLIPADLLQFAKEVM
jgi:hypothetical protein